GDANRAARWSPKKQCAEFPLGSSASAGLPRTRLLQHSPQALMCQDHATLPSRRYRSSLSSRQRKRDVARGYLLPSRLAAAGRDHHELPPVDLVGRGRRVPRRRERRLPEQVARGLVERAELIVVVRRPDEYQPARSDHRTAVVLAPGVRHPRSRELAILPKWD